MTAAVPNLHDFTLMVGAFGLFDDHHTRIPADRLIEGRARLDVTMLLRHGALIDLATTELRYGDRGYLLAARTPDLLVDGNPVRVVWTDWALPWFECPLCGRRCRHVYLLDPIACRRCHRLDYASRHLYRQTPAVHRVARLRRKLTRGRSRRYQRAQQAVARPITRSWWRRSRRKSRRSLST